MKLHFQPEWNKDFHRERNISNSLHCRRLCVSVGYTALRAREVAPGMDFDTQAGARGSL